MALTLLSLYVVLCIFKALYKTVPHIVLQGSNDVEPKYCSVARGSPLDIAGPALA